jgi:predicted PurR-regulated permease PerM
LVWGSVVVYFLMAGPLWKALAMLGWGIGVVVMIDQFLRPWLIGQAAQIPVLFLVFSVLGGLALYGLIGLFVGPVLVSLLMTIVQIYREEYHNAEIAPPPSSAPPS